MLRPDQLPGQLSRGLAPLYLVAGEEPLLVQEAADRIRARAREAGADEREVLHVEAGFDWSRLSDSGDSLSLFARRRLVELRLSEAKPGDAGSRALVRYAERLPEDVTLLVIAGRLDRRARASAWFRALERAGIVVYAWPVKRAQWPQWIAARCRAGGLAAEPQAVEVLAERTEGNLLACAQEIQKLALLYPDGRLDRERALASVGDHARFDVFDLPDRVLSGQVRQAVRSLQRLREEGVEPVLVLWALTRDLRLLVRASAKRARGASAEQALRSAGVWSFRQPAFRAALSRFDEAGARALLARAARVDRVVKGVCAGQPWGDLLELCCVAAGRPLPATSPDSAAM